MEAPPPEVFKAVGLLLGFLVGYYVLFKPKPKK